VEEGIVAGGGVAYINALPALKQVKLTGDAVIGVDIMRRALEEPARQIAHNAGMEGSVVVAKIKNLPKGQGLDVLTEKYVDMMEAGIVDPAKVTRSALENATSIAVMVLSTEAAVAEIPEKEKAPAAPGGMPPY
jgi:chaperonin GroEL